MTQRSAEFLHWLGATFLAIGSVLVFAVPAHGAIAKISAEPRGAVVETDRYRATVRDGALAGFLNRLTAEEYLSVGAPTADWLPHLPNGLGTQNRTSERESSRALFEWPWWEFPVDTNWPNQHFPDGQSKFSFAAHGAAAALLTYRGLSNGKERFPDEVFTLELQVDDATGDLLVTPRAQSPQAGVYGCGFAVGTLARAVTVEAPIFEGVRLDRQMERKLYSNAWPGYWDYGFLALNGERTGAVGVWCQDAELKFYKNLFFRVSEQGLGFSLFGLNVPPFDDLKTAGTLTWRLQAFDRSWTQAAARFRDWRVANQQLAVRHAWVTNISFLNYGMNRVDPWGIGMLQNYFAGLDLNRVITWAPAVRGAGFDKNHADNAPYAGCASDMAAWRSAGLRVMAYLQPMIMWSPNPTTDRQRQGVEFSNQAISRGPFLPDRNTSVRLHDYHNLAQPDWQGWFLSWVSEYIRDCGFNGIYHDSTYHCSLDVRGLEIGGMTAPQGMADYFRKAAAQNPGTIHATEHLTEVNSVAASLGLGCGIIWGAPGYKGGIGPVGSMNWQRIKRASAVGNALPGPQSAIVGFPHQSNFTEYGPVRFHQGMDQMEARGDLPAIPLGRHDPVADPVVFTNAVNEIWLDRQRALAFVRHGLRAVFPENWQRGVRSYFQGADGTGFRYEERPWGTAFLESSPTGDVLHYGRAQGVTRVDVNAGMAGWPAYGTTGPVGLDPAQAYCLDPNLKPPAACFDLLDDDACVKEGFANDAFAYVQLQPLTNGVSKVRLVLRSALAPAALWVDGEATVPAPTGEAGPASARCFAVPAKANSMVVAIFRELAPGGWDPVAGGAVSRLVQQTSRRDLLRPSAFANSLVGQKDGVRITAAGMLTYNRLRGDSQALLPLRAPTGSGSKTLRLSISTTAAPGAAWNGRPLAWESGGGSPPLHTAELTTKAGDAGLLNLTVSSGGLLKLAWRDAR